MVNLTTHIEQEALKDLFKTAWQFLKKASFNDERLASLPWYWLMGPPQSGKTVLINQAELNLIPAKHLATDPKDEGEHNKRCNWWLCDQATLLDIPGAYLAADNSNSMTLNWQQFLHVAKKYIRQKPPSGIILTLALPDWAEQTKTQQQEFTQKLRQDFLLLSKHLETYCPVYLVLTKVDKIAGFTEFFSDLGQEERREIWGMNLTQNNPEKSPSLPSLFKMQLDQMLKRLHDRVIWRVHQERNVERRALIQHFPWQMENLKSGLAAFLYQLGDILGLRGPTPLQGIYFASNTQHGKAVDCIPKTASKELMTATTADHEMVIWTPQQSAYFTQNLLQKFIFSQTEPIKFKPHLRRHKKSQLSGYLLASGLVLGSSFFMVHSLDTKINNLNAAEMALLNYRNLTKELPPFDPNLSQTLPALDALYHSVNLLHQASVPWAAESLHSATRLTQLADAAYDQALSHYFLAGLGSMLEPILANTNNPESLYDALRIYLMLGNPVHFDPIAIRNWFSTYWQQTLKDDPDLENRLMIHLNAFLEHRPTPLALNQQLIDKARNTLTTMPYPQLAYDILKSQSKYHLNNPFHFDTPEQTTAFDKVFTITNNSAEIPSLYTARRFQEVYFQDIPHICSSVQNGDWVLGLQARPSSTLEDQQALIETVRQLYLQDYANTWKKFLANLQIVNWKNWQQGLDALNNITAAKSPLFQVLNIVLVNTALDKLISLSHNITIDDLQTIQTNLTNQFQGINNILTVSEITKQNSFGGILQDLTQLKNYLTTIAKANNSDRAALDAAKQRLTSTNLADPINSMAKRAAQLPMPIQGWLNAIAANSWQLLLSHSAQYLNDTWQSQILSYYLDHLNNRYPLFKNSIQDISLTDFAHFFGPGGLMDSFFKNDLSAFIDTSQANWHYRSFENQTIKLSPAILTQLERANLMRAMFFNSNNQLSVSFVLQPIALELDVASFTFSLNGQTFTQHYTDKGVPHYLTWPNNLQQPVTTLTFSNHQGHNASKTEFGPWGLFRVLDQANLQALDNIKTFQLTFDLNGNAARYHLLASDPINPFVPGIIDAFRCPDSLL